MSEEPKKKRNKPFRGLSTAQRIRLQRKLETEYRDIHVHIDKFSTSFTVSPRNVTLQFERFNFQFHTEDQFLSDIQIWQSRWQNLWANVAPRLTANGFNLADLKEGDVRWSAARFSKSKIQFEIKNKEGRKIKYELDVGEDIPVVGPIDFKQKGKIYEGSGTGMPKPRGIGGGRKPGTPNKPKKNK